LEVRDRDDLQDLERLLIAACSPSLNSSRGGIRHSLLPHHLAPRRPDEAILSRPIERWPFTSALDLCLLDSRQFYSIVPNQLTGPPITDQAFQSLRRHAQRGSTVDGVLPTLAIGSDITLESFTSTRMDMGFSDRLTGPGPRATDQVRLQALGLHHRANREDRIALNSFVDFWALTINHDVLWIPLLQMTRIILKLRPVLLRPCSSKLCNLFVNGSFRDGFAPITAHTQSVSTNFFNGRSPPTWHELQSLVSEEGLSLKWSECHSYRWSDIVGEIFVVPVREIWALCLPDFDGGVLKYDPRMIEVIGDLKRVIALKGVVAEQVITNHVKDEGGPGSSLEEFSRLKQAIEAECRGKG
jgi:hypothetical protein